jgi:predicted dehydrogenase
MNIVVVGAGAIGKERIKALETLKENIVAVIEPNAILSQLADYPCYRDIIDIIGVFTPDWFFICTPHNKSIQIINALYRVSSKILVEKPYLGDLKPANVGFNYRFYKGVAQLLKDCKEKVFGDLISVNMTLALGDAPGTEKTWRLDTKQAGRGAILDPGIHLIDLMFQITDKPLKTHCFHSLDTFWKTGIEEECHLIASDGETIFNIQASKVRWRNEFKIQVNGTEGYGIIEGRNRNYGNQTYLRGKRWGWQSGKSQKESEELVVDYDGEDSFLEETKAVLYGGEIKPATWEDNLKCIQFIERL